MNVHHQSAKPNGAQPPRSVHPGSGRRQTRETPKGRQVDPQALDEVRALLGDRPRRRDLLIEHLHLLQDQLRLPARAPSRGARRRDAAGAGRGLRGRLLLRPFRHRHGRRAGPAAAHGPGLRQPDLRADGRRAPARATCRARSGRACASSARPAWAAATTRPSRRSAMRCMSTRASRASRRRSPPARRIRTSRATSTSTRYRAEGGYTLLAECLDGKRAGRGRHQDARGLRACAASAARASRPGASGASCAPSRRRASWRSTPTRASPAPSRTASISRPTRTASSKAC